MFKDINRLKIKKINIFIVAILFGVFILTSCSFRNTDNELQSEVDAISEEAELAEDDSDELEGELDEAEGDSDLASNEEDLEGDFEEDLEEFENEDLGLGDEDLELAEAEGKEFGEDESSEVEVTADEFVGAEGDEITELAETGEFQEEVGEKEGQDIAKNEEGDELDEYGGEEIGGEDATDLAASEAENREVAQDDTMETNLIEGAGIVGETAQMTEGGNFPADNTEMEAPVQRTWVPVKKIASTPFRKNGILVNAIYLARPGDTLASVSNKIYGADRTNELLNVNTTLGRGLKVGDKVYYNSPQRPTDDSQLMVYYQEMNLSPELYVSQSGDNIRKISMELLGDEGSWKEVWAINPSVESKGEIPSGTELRYWSDASLSKIASSPPPSQTSENKSNNSMNEPEPMDNDPASATTVAEGDFPPPPSPSQPEMSPPDPMIEVAPSTTETAAMDPNAEGTEGLRTAAAENPSEPAVAPPAPSEVAGAEPAAPMPTDEGRTEDPVTATAAVGSVGTPPPPPAADAPNSPSELGAQPQKTEGLDPVLLAGVGLVLFGVVLMFIIIRKRRTRKDMDFNTAILNNTTTMNNKPAV